jgi:BASS family bile acid:Na+ symporter
MIRIFADYEYVLTVLIAVATMIGMGTTLKAKDFWRVIRWPRAVLLTFVIQVVVVPPLAILMAYVLGLQAGVGFGLLFVSALPGGSYSNLLTHLGRGNGALSITATSASTLACPVTVVFVLNTYGTIQLPETIVIPTGSILREVLALMFIPLLFGMFARGVLPKHFKKLGRYCIRVSVALLALYIMGALLGGRVVIAHHGWRAPLAVVLLAAATVWLSYGLGLLARLPGADMFTVVIEVVVRNIQLGLLLKAKLFPAGDDDTSGIADDVLFVLLCYGGVSLLAGGLEVAAHRMRFGLIFGPVNLRGEKPSGPSSTS